MIRSQRKRVNSRVVKANTFLCGFCNVPQNLENSEYRQWHTLKEAVVLLKEDKRKGYSTWCHVCAPF